MENFVTQEYYQLISEGEAKFILDQSEKKLKDTIDTSSGLLTRLTTLISITSTLMVALVGCIISRLETHNFADKLIITAVLGILYLFIITIMIYRNIKPQPYYSIGFLPKDVFIDRVFNDKNKEYRLTAIYINEIEEHQKRILANKVLNDSRWRLYTNSLLMLVLTPVFLGIVYLLLASVFRCFCL